MILPDFRPRLAAKARLHYDRHADRHLLLYPEKGLALNPTATEILKLCTGERTVTQIVSELEARYDGSPKQELEREVYDFLEALASRGLVEGAP